MIHPVKYLHSEMRGAPAISGTPGALIGALDACMSTGFGLVTITGITVSGGVATATVAPGNSFEEGAIVLISGATPVDLNGEARVLMSSNSSFTFATVAVDGTASGTISAKYAPVHSWSKIHAATNVAVWQSVDPQANGHCLRIDDTGTTHARVVGYETMVDADNGSGPFPTPAQISGGGYWPKSSSDSSHSVLWWFFADSRLFYLIIAPGTPINKNQFATGPRYFGDPISLSPAGDAWNTALSVLSVSSFSPYLNSGTPDNSAASGVGGYGAVVCARPLSSLGGSSVHDHLPYIGTGTTGVSGMDGRLGTFPSTVDGALPLSRVTIKAPGASSNPRALVPGFLYAPVSGLNAHFTPGNIVVGSGTTAGRRLVALFSGGTSSMGATSMGVYFLDATGPWR